MERLLVSGSNHTAFRNALRVTFHASLYVRLPSYVLFCSGGVLYLCFYIGSCLRQALGGLHIFLRTF